MELDRLSARIPGALITPVQHTIETDDGVKHPLNPAQFEEYQRLAGRQLVYSVSQEMQTPEWQQMDDQARVLRVRDIQSDSKAAVKAAVGEAFFGQQQ